jgi:hypothetical protein
MRSPNRLQMNLQRTEQRETYGLRQRRDLIGRQPRQCGDRFPSPFTIRRRPPQIASEAQRGDFAF